MFKKLDKLIVKAFVGPFIATFFVVLLVLVMQFFWLYIDDFVGKGLGIGLIFEFIWYQSAVLVPLALPLSVLLSSIMTFGNLGESFELVAIKSAGISLLRFMRPLFVVTILICGVAFLFSNYIIPIANLKSRTLLADIVYAKPAFDLKEGVFYDRINGFAIKIGKKENDSVIRNIIIYEQGGNLQDNFIIANSGVMRVTDNKRFLEFNLKNGWRYQEKGQFGTVKTEFIRLGFKEFTKQFDLSSFQFNRTDDSINRSNQRMLSMRQLNIAIDSLEKIHSNISASQGKEIFSSMQFARYLDSSWTVSSSDLPDSVKTFDEVLPDSARIQVGNQVAQRIGIPRSNLLLAVSESTSRARDIRLHKIEWHRKISLSLACLVLFIIGAPLGSIIRKGGLGSPLIFAIIFFMLFYFLSTSGEKFAKEGALTPFTGMWLSTFGLVPMGIFLTYKAMRDSQLFNKEFYYRVITRIKKARNKRNSMKNQVSSE
ncbi:MAG: LptF/LptG family permease [Chitinophagaceae bacterium]|nr:LptF/LptG family permease [Chitinophagaceae bacterium]